MIINLKEKLLEMKKIKVKQIKIFNRVLEENFDAVKYLFENDNCKITLNKDSYNDDCIYLYIQFVPPEGFEKMEMATYKFNFTGVTWDSLKSIEDYKKLSNEITFKNYIEEKLIDLLNFIILHHGVNLNQEKYVEKKYKYTFDFNEFFKHKVVIRFKRKEDLRVFINYLTEKYGIEYKTTELLNIYETFIKNILQDYGLCGTFGKRFSVIDITDLEENPDDRIIFDFDDIEFEDMKHLIATEKLR